MKSFVETVVGGAIGLIALYVVGKVAYQAGKDVARAECEYVALQNKIDSNADRETVTVHGVDDNGEEVTKTIVKKESTVEFIPATPAKKQSKLSMALGAMKLFHRKDSVIGDLVKHPEAHKIEAFVEGGDLCINVSKRPASA